MYTPDSGLRRRLKDAQWWPVRRIIDVNTSQSCECLAIPAFKSFSWPQLREFLLQGTLYTI